jgi:UDP-N-acetylglucosamine 2-epimerase (non-hydrolysing)
MSDTFFSDLSLSGPDVYLGVGSDTHARQTADVMVEYEKACIEIQPDIVAVVGDVNPTMACALVATKMHLPVGHLEAGLRSGDRTMPEEINRIVTDSISDVLWTHSQDADNNLIHEGIPAERIDRVGNIMIDSYEMLKAKIAAENMPDKMGLVCDSYGVVTLHRPSNVDIKSTLGTLVSSLVKISKYLPLVFSVHPRTQEKLKDFKLWEEIEEVAAIHLLEPLSYIHFMSLVKDAKLIMTDSGGIQEETTYLNTPCLTLRNTTERPVTITQGTNRIVSPNELEACVQGILSGDWPQAVCPEYWDGLTAGRVVKSMQEYLTK